MARHGEDQEWLFDSTRDAEEAAEYRARAHEWTPEEVAYWREHYQRIYRQEAEAVQAWEAAHPEEMALIAEKQAEWEREFAARNGIKVEDMPKPDQSLLDDLFGGD